MKIVVTGGAGFIGSAVVRLAVATGHDVVNVDALTYSGCLRNLDSISKSEHYTFEQVNISDRTSLDAVLAHHLPDVVMHLAAETHVDRSIDNPQVFLETNILGTFNMLEATTEYWRKQNKPESFRFHHISTDEVYGSLNFNSANGFREDSPYDPRNPYSASKASSDHLVRAWFSTYGLPILITNCSNNYGPFHFPEKLMPVVILNALAGKSIPVYGDGGNVRDWLYVEDHAEALLTVVNKGIPGRAYNIGGESEYSNIEVVKKICRALDKARPRALGSYEDLISFVRDRPGHDLRYAIDTSRIKRELGWQPSVSLDEGIEKTVNWYLNNEDWWRPLLEKSDVGIRLGTKH